MAGLASWVLALPAVEVSDLGPWGLLPELPLLWYLGLALTSAVAIHTIAFERVFRRGLATAAATSLIAILYGTTTLVEDAPRQAWTYKHIGVTRYIMAHGSLDPSLDIYQRWPGGFAFGALLSEAPGSSDPLALAQWAPTFFVAAASLLVLALAKTLSSSDRAAFAAVLVFVCTNWTGQMYYAPQSVALILHLATLLLVLRWFRTGAGPVGTRLERILSMATRAPTVRASCSRQPSGFHVRRMGACVVLLHVASTLTHQLTAWVTVGSLLLLACVGYVRCWRLLVLLGTITAAYLVPHLGFVEENYGIIDGLNLLNNYRPRVEAATPLIQEKVLLGSLAVYLSLLVGLLALYGLWTCARRCRPADAVLCAVLIGTPLLLGLVQSYGGEAQQRAFLFASPWCAIAMGWAAVRGPDAGPRNLLPDLDPSWRRRVAAVRTGVAFVLVLCLFVPLSFGNEDVYWIPRTEVAACEVLSSRYPDGVTFVLSVPGFPIKCSADYDEHVGPFRGDTPNLVSTDPRFGANDFTADVARSTDIVWGYVRQYGPDSLLIFSTSQANSARAWNVFGGEAGYRRLEEAVASSGRFSLVYENTDTRVYRLVLAAGP